MGEVFILNPLKDEEENQRLINRGKNRGQAPIEITPIQENIDVPSTSSSPKIPKVYQRKSVRLSKLDLVSPVNQPIYILSPQVVSPPIEASTTHTTKPEVIKGIDA